MIKDSSSDLTNISAYECFGEDYIITGNGDISFAFELELPGVFSLDEENYNSLFRKFNHLISGSDDDVVFHFMNLVYIDQYEKEIYHSNYTTRNDINHFLGRPYLNTKNYLIISFPTVLNDYWATHSSTSFIKTAQALKEDVFQKIADKGKKIREKADALENEFSSLQDVKVSRLNGNKLTDFIFNVFNGSFDRWETDINSSSKIDPIYVKESGIEIGGEHVGVISFTNEASNFKSFDNVEIQDTELYASGVNFNNRFGMPTSIGYAMSLGIPLKHIVHTVIQPRSKESIQAQLKKTNAGVGFLRGLGNDDAKRKELDVETYSEQIIEDKGCSFNQSIWIYADTEKELKKNLALCKSEYRNVGTGVESFVENRQTANLYFSTLPGVARENFMYLFSTVQRSLAYLPLEDHVNIDTHGFEFSDLFGRRIVIDLKNNKHTTNPNKVVFGPSGTGKSVFLNAYLGQALQLGYHVVVLDVGGSYRANVSVNHGAYIDCGERKNMSFNIFDTDKDHKGRYIYRSMDDSQQVSVNKVLFVYVVFAKILYGDKQDLLESEESKRFIQKGIEEYYKQTNKEIEAGKDVFMSMDGFVSFFNEYYKSVDEGYKKFIQIESINLLLEPYIKGGDLEYLLNGDVSIDIKNDKFVVFDVQAIEKDANLLSIVSTIIVDIVERKMNTLPLQVPKIFNIDEALDFLSGNSMGEYIAGMYRKIRKKGGEVIIAAQDAKFLDSCSDLVKDSITANAEYKIVLGLNTEESVKAAQRIMGLTSKEVELIKGLQPKGEFFIKIGNNNRMLLKNELSPQTLATFTTDPKELGKIKALEKEYGGDIITALNNYVELKEEEHV